MEIAMMRLIQFYYSLRVNNTYHFWHEHGLQKLTLTIIYHYNMYKSVNKYMILLKYLYTHTHKMIMNSHCIWKMNILKWFIIKDFKVWPHSCLKRQVLSAWWEYDTTFHDCRLGWNIPSPIFAARTREQVSYALTIRNFIVCIAVFLVNWLMHT